MAQLNGYGGSVQLGANTIAELDEWDITIDSKMLDRTTFGSGWEQKKPGLAAWTAKASGHWDQTDTNGQAALQTDLLTVPPTEVTPKFQTGTHYYSGSAYISSFVIKAAVADLITVEISFEGDGSIVMT